MSVGEGSSRIRRVVDMYNVHMRIEQHSVLRKKKAYRG